MSNIFRQFAAIFLCLVSLATASGHVVDRERLEKIEDDTLMFQSAEKSARDYLFDILRRSTQVELDKAAFAEVGFVELSRQPKEYRGKLVTVRGSLRRCQFIPEKQEPSPFDEETRKPTGYYESRILLKDEKRTPIAVYSLEIPEGFPLGDKIDEKKGEQVELTGFFFKRQFFLSEDNEEVTTPTLLAKNFRWFPDTKQEVASQKTTRWFDQYFWQILIVLVVMWIALRTLTRRRERRPMVAVPFLATLLSVTAPALAQTPPKIDAEFTKMLLRMDDYAWDALGDEKIPLEQQREEVFNMMHELRTAVPRGFLYREPTLFDSNLRFPESFRGKAFRLEGTVTFVEELPLNPVQRRTFRLPMFFRCRLLLFEHRPIELLTPTVPVAWKRNEPISENAVAVGIYIKRLQADDESLIPLFVAPDIEWYPDTPLGNLGMNVASLDQIPVLRITDRNKKELDVAEPLQLLDRSEILRRAFRLRYADREPFYGLLRATKNLAGTPVPSDIPAPLLFTEPEKHRNELVRFHGTAKRVIPVLVDDKEIQELYGITKYYEIYFYTKDSQGHPLVACVTKLPKGMPVGADDKYAEEISISGFFYKLWIYDSAEIIEKEGGESYKPTFAPLLIGHSPNWHPKKRGTKPSDGAHWMTTLSFTTFGCLAVVWYILRRFRSTKPIEFKLGR